MQPLKTDSKSAVVLIDPVSSGRFLKQYVPAEGLALIGVFTLSDEELKDSGKFIPHQEKIKHCDMTIFQRDAEVVLGMLRSAPYPIVAVIAASEPGVEMADYLTTQLGLKGNPLSSSIARRDKFQTRAALERNGIPGARFCACTSLDQAIEFAETCGLPVVAKTPKGAGAHHVFVCQTYDEVKSAYQEVIEGKNIFGDAASFVLLEEFISGQQYAVELFADGAGLKLTSLWQLNFTKNSDGKNTFDKLAPITDNERIRSLKPLTDYALRVGEAVDVKYGPCLVELRDDPIRGPSLIEVGTRLSGIDMPVVIRESSNFDPYWATIQAFLPNSGFSVPNVEYSKHSCLVFCSIDGHGVIEKIRGVEEIEKLPSHLMNHLYISKGDVITPSSHLATIPLYVYLSHESREQLETDIAKTRKLFDVDFKTQTQPPLESKEVVSERSQYFAP